MIRKAEQKGSFLHLTVKLKIKTEIIEPELELRTKCSLKLPMFSPLFYLELYLNSGPILIVT